MMRAIFILILSGLVCFVYSQPELAIEENISDSGIKSVLTKSIKLENICFTADHLNSIDFTIYHEKSEDSVSFYFECELWLNLNDSSLSETLLAIVLEDERIVHMLQDGEATVIDKKKMNPEYRGKVGLPKFVSCFSTGYEPIVIDKEIDTADEAWDALKSCKFSKIHLVSPEGKVEFTFYPEKGFKRNNALLFVDYFQAIDESQ